MSEELFPRDDRVPPLSLDHAPDDGSRRYGPDELAGEDRRYIRGPAWLPWLVVIALTMFMMVSAIVIQSNPNRTTMSRGELLQPIWMGKIAIGIREIGKNANANDFQEQAETFAGSIDFGPVEQRLCHAILTNEFFGAERALKTLANLRTKTQRAEVRYTAKQERLEAILTGVFEAGVARQPPDVSAADRDFIKDEMLWYGELAMNPPGSGNDKRVELLQNARLSVTVLIVGIIAGLLLFGIGLILFFVFGAQILRGALRHRVADDSRYGPVYIETFAIWFLLFLGVSYAASRQGGEGLGMGTALLTMVLPLSALIWPVIRGVSIRELLQDTGLQLKNPFVEVAAGVVAYLAMLPLLLAGMIASAILITILGLLQTSVTNEFAPSGVPHPIANEAFNGNLIQVMITIFFIAAVLAPLVEEIMFRGVLYRTLRDSSRRMSRWASVGFAALFSSLIFAAIHPQGLAGIPILTTLAIGFCLVRQWRGSLIAPMTMHAIHNAAATSMLIPMLI